MRNLRGTRQAKKLRMAMLDLVSDFDDELTNAGMPGRIVDAHVASILIDLLQLMVVERQTFSGDDLTSVFKEMMQDRQHEH